MAAVRMAFFEGTVRPGAEAAFRAYLDERLVPLWTSFPHLVSFRMLPGGRSDDGAPPYALVLEFTYPSMAAMNEALASDVRSRSREVTMGLFDYFDGRIMHIVCEAVDHPPRR